jgi:hypothetical protein
MARSEEMMNNMPDMENMGETVMDYIVPALRELFDENEADAPFSRDDFERMVEIVEEAIESG